MTVLDGVRVLDRTGGIAGPYCTKLLADAGADVVKDESAGPDPLRDWNDGTLFEFLNASKRSVIAGGDALAGAADIIVAPATASASASVGVANPRTVVVTITPFGGDGPWAARPATEFTLQAACGSTGSRGLPEQEPLAAGGRVGEWATGTYAAVAAVAALRVADRDGAGVHVDVSMFDCMAVTMATMPSVFSSFMGWPEFAGTGRTIEVPSIEPARDGWVVFTTNSAQQFEDFCIMIGRPDFLEDPKLARAAIRFVRRAEFLAAVHDYTTARSRDELLEQASAFRIPSGPVLEGAATVDFPHFRSRGVYVPGPTGRFVQPRVPFRIVGDEPRPFAVPPRVGEHSGAVDWPRRDESSAPATAGEDRGLPLAGTRVLDCTAWWAGPAATHVLACLGADVVKVESHARPDLMRYTTTKPPTTDAWWEWGPMFHGANTSKRGITLDLTTPAGVATFERLVATADLVVENYTPRVMDQFGLGWERLHSLNPRLVMVRMPAFGLDGPWRDQTGFAQTMESVSGMAAMTGFRDGPPVLVRGACDPLAGMHAVVATLLALRRRDATAEGTMVEVPMVEAALNATAEAVVSSSPPRRDGNRGPAAAPQGVYPCAGVDRWVAIAVETDEQWAALRGALGDLSWAAPAALATAAGRRAAHDTLDKHLAAWTGGRDADDVADALCAAGVPAAAVIPAPYVVRNPQIRARRLFEVEHHPVTGDHEVPGLPFRMSGVDAWVSRPSPTLGQHTVEVLLEAGFGDDDLAALEAAGVTGTRPV